MHRLILTVLFWVTKMIVRTNSPISCLHWIREGEHQLTYNYLLSYLLFGRLDNLVTCAPPNSLIAVTWRWLWTVLSRPCASSRAASRINQLRITSSCPKCGCHQTTPTSRCRGNVCNVTYLGISNWQLAVSCFEMTPDRSSMVTSRENWTLPYLVDKLV